MKIPSEDFVRKRIETSIEGESGAFYGIFCKSTGLPDGSGVFVSVDWVHCGEVKNGVFQDGRKLSANRLAKILTLTNKKYLADGSVLKKIERFSKQGVERYFCKNDEEIAKVNTRLNQVNKSENWLSMRPHAQFFKQDEDITDFGEFEEDRLHGRGIGIYDDGAIIIGYCENGFWSTGNYIQID